MKRIFIAPKGQFGYNTDYFKMSNYLAKQGIKVDILCFDQGFKKIEAPLNVNVTYVNLKNNNIINYINYLIKIFKHIITERNNYNWLLLSGTIEYCGVVPLFLRKFISKTTWLIDIRTGAVAGSEKRRRTYDNSMRWSVKFFNHITIISGLLAKKLGIQDYFILPLGADPIIDVSKKELKKDTINFLYVGTFENRNIDRVIKAYDIFCTKLDPQIKTKFDIVGFSNTKKTEQTILNALKNVQNKNRIIYHGRKAHDEIIELFEEATVGLSYVPITDYYDVQPPTKTFEYIINGIICLGTNTKANAQIINKKNGVLISDDVDSVIEGMEIIQKSYFKYNCVKLSNTIEDYSWIKIEERFYKFLQEINLKDD